MRIELVFESFVTYKEVLCLELLFFDADLLTACEAEEDDGNEDGNEGDDDVAGEVDAVGV